MLDGVDQTLLCGWAFQRRSFDRDVINGARSKNDNAQVDMPTSIWLQSFALVVTCVGFGLVLLKDTFKGAQRPRLAEPLAVRIVRWCVKIFVWASHMFAVDFA